MQIALILRRHARRSRSPIRYAAKSSSSFLHNTSHKFKFIVSPTNTSTVVDYSHCYVALLYFTLLQSKTHTMNQNTLSQQQQQQYAAAGGGGANDEGHSSPAVLGTSQQPQVVPLYELSPGNDTTKNNIDNNESGLLHYHPRQRGAGFAPSSGIVVVSNKPRVGAATTTTTRVRDLKSDKIVDAWDKIGTLTSEMTQSIMKKQADFVAKRYRLGGNGGGGGSSERGEQQGPYKKRRMELEESSSSSSSSSSSEEESGSSPVTTTPLVLPEENWSESLSRHVDRMALMSKLIMEIEYCHRLLRKKMVEIQNDLCSC